MPYGGHRHRSDSTVSSSRHIRLDGGPELAAEVAEVRHGAVLRSRAHRKQVSSLSVNCELQIDDRRRFEWKQQ
jgi:hypothetical protein